MHLNTDIVALSFGMSWEAGQDISPAVSIVKMLCVFQALADRIAVHCSLVRGEYNRAWNEVLLTEDCDEDSMVSPH